MKNLLSLLVVALLAILAFVLFLREPLEAPDLALELGAASTAGAAVDPEALNPEPPLELRGPELLEAREAAEALAETSSAAAAPGLPDFDGPWTRVEGQIVDQEGEPLEGTRVQLRIYRAPEGADLPELPRLGNEGSTRRSSGVETLTDESGRFGLDAPFGKESSYWLHVAADRFHDSALIRFGRDGIQPLVEGLVEVGEIRLGVTGSVFGTVTTVRGRPLADVQLDTGPERSSTYQRGSLSKADGTFVIPHAIVGTYMVKAKLEGYLSKQEGDVTVRTGEDTGPIDLVLEEAPRIEGRIVDEAGAPIENVRLFGWPKSSGSGGGASSKADGSFVVYLPQAEPYTMKATHPDYEQWGDERGEQYEPGTNLGTITLTKAPQVSFSVADKASGEPVLTFGLKIDRNEGSGAGSRSTTFYNLPRITQHPEGVVTLGATATRDLYVAYAPGFLMEQGDVEPTEESVAAGSPAQRILLDRGAGIKGRLVSNGEPLAGVSINLTPGGSYGREFSPQDRLAFKIESGPNGEFETTGLKPGGKTRFTATRPLGGAPLVLMLEGLESGAYRDLGDIEFLEGGTVVGQVLLPEGIDPGGITVYRGDWKEDVNQVTDSTGVFRFEDVPAGESSFGQRGRPEVFESGGTVKVMVEPGATAEVLFDLRDQAFVDVELEVDLGTLPAAGLRVDLSPAAPEGDEMAVFRSSNQRIRLGDTDEHGVVRSRCRALKEARVGVTLPQGQRLLNDGGAISLAYGPPFAERVSFTVNSLVVDLGSYRSQLTDGTLRIDFLKPEGLPFARHYIRLPLEDGELQPTMKGWATIAGTEMTIHGVEAGEWNLTVYASKKDAPKVETKLPSGGMRMGPKREFEFTSHVVIRPGEVARAQNSSR